MECRAYAAEKNDVDSSGRTVVATINTDGLDRYRTVVDPAGAMLDNYRKNPVVLVNHGEDTSALPIGKNLWIKAQKRKLIAKTQFLPEGEDETADKVFRLYELGFLNGWSVRFDPTESGPPTAAEVKARSELAGCRCIYRKWDLVEYSCVTVPANAEAVRRARGLGLALPGWPEAEPGPASEPAIQQMPQLPPLVGRSMAQVEQAVRKQLQAQLGDSRQMVRDIFDLARGRV